MPNPTDIRVRDGYYICYEDFNSYPPTQHCEFYPNPEDGGSTSNPPPPGSGQPQPSPANQPQPSAPDTQTTPVNQLDVRVVEGLRVIDGKQRSASGTEDECGVLGASGRNRGVESATWDNPQFVAAEGGQASIPLNGQSDTLLAQDFGFSIPDTGSIDLIRVCTKRRVLGDASLTDETVSLISCGYEASGFVEGEEVFYHDYTLPPYDTTVGGNEMQVPDYPEYNYKDLGFDFYNDATGLRHLYHSNYHVSLFLEGFSAPTKAMYTLSVDLDAPFFSQTAVIGVDVVDPEDQPNTTWKGVTIGGDGVAYFRSYDSGGTGPALTGTDLGAIAFGSNAINTVMHVTYDAEANVSNLYSENGSLVGTYNWITPNSGSDQVILNAQNLSAGTGHAEIKYLRISDIAISTPGGSPSSGFIEEGSTNSLGQEFVCELTPVRSGAPDVTADFQLRELKYTASGDFTPAQVNDRHFGVAYSVNGTSGSVHVDSIKVEVLYALGQAEADDVPPALQRADHNTLLAVTIDRQTGNMCAVGGAGKVLLSTDNGVTWVPKTSNTVSILTAVTTTSSGYVAVGQGGAFIRSQDSGDTWAQISTGDNESRYHVVYSLIEQDVMIGGDGDSHIVSQDLNKATLRFRYSTSVASQ